MGNARTGHFSRKCSGDVAWHGRDKSYGFVKSSSARSVVITLRMEAIDTEVGGSTRFVPSGFRRVHRLINYLSGSGAKGVAMIRIRMADVEAGLKTCI